MEAVNYEHEFMDRLLTSFDHEEQMQLIDGVPECYISNPEWHIAYRVSVRLIQSGKVADGESVLEYINSLRHTKKMFFAIAQSLEFYRELTLPVYMIIQQLEADYRKRQYQS